MHPVDSSGQVHCGGADLYHGTPPALDRDGVVDAAHSCATCVPGLQDDFASTEMIAPAVATM